MKRLMSLVVLIFLAVGAIHAQEMKPREWMVDGVKRQAIIQLPVKASNGPIPVIFGFHGHGGSMNNYARKDFRKLWPEAILVSPQGLPTPGKTDPDGIRAGWQKTKGDQKDRDLHFVDALLKTLHEEHTIDDSRIFVTGHSNGGGFTYLLWSERPTVFAAYAPSAAGFRGRNEATPAPILHLAGEKDQTVPFENQKRTMESIRKINQCSETVTDWAPKCKLYASQVNAPFISYIHGGDHKYSDEANALIVRFFKENARKVTTEPIKGTRKK